ncbi:MAG: FAD-dependent oxidoreductase [Hyphomonadaceae bacterium]|nr:FAD-dependent oxidoreductase [Hyphomonadaceae bacterium]
MKPTDIKNPDYFHKVVDCQWACPAHTPVPEYIRLIAAQRYTDAFMINWKSNVFPGILGRTCDRPCEPACRRGRVEDAAGKPEPVAICRLKRVAADNKDAGVEALMPPPVAKKNGKRVACIGAGPASLTVARDLLAIGYEVHIFDGDKKAGGMIRTQIPRFRLPESVIDEEVSYVTRLEPVMHLGERVESLKAFLAQGWDAVFVGTGAPRGRDLQLPGQKEAAANVHIGIDWLSSVSFEHIDKIGKRVIVLGGGNTAMDCCRTSRRLGGEDVKVVVRSGFDEMKASPWEKEDAMHEGIPILNFLNPREITHQNGKLTGVWFTKMQWVEEGGKRKLVPTGEPDVHHECDDVLMAVGQENAFPWIERDIGMDFDKWDMPVVDQQTMQSTVPSVFFGGDAAFGPKNIIWAVAHGHDAAVSIDLYLNGKDVRSDRPPPGVAMMSTKMGIHEWSYDNDISLDLRFKVPQVDPSVSLRNVKVEVEKGFDPVLAFKEAQRCLNCDVQTVFAADLCIECDACVDICPMDCITFTENGEETELRERLNAPAKNLTQDLYIQDGLKTGRIMAKDEDVCLHCGLCAERCPTGAWDMQQFYLEVTHAGCSSAAPPVRSRQLVAAE